MALPSLLAFAGSQGTSAPSVEYATDSSFKTFSGKIFAIMTSILSEKRARAELLDRIDRSAAEAGLERVSKSTERDDDAEDLGETKDKKSGILGMIASAIAVVAGIIKKIYNTLSNLMTILKLIAHRLKGAVVSLAKFLAKLLAGLKRLKTSIKQASRKVARSIARVPRGRLGLLGLGVAAAAATAYMASSKDDEEPEEPTVPGAPISKEPTTPYEGLGSVTRKYESGGRGVATISSGAGDAGGVSYGVYQLSSKKGTMAKFLRSEEGRSFAQAFGDSEPGTPEFNKIYAQVASTRGREFEKAQHDFIVRTHYEPALKIAGSLGFAVGDPRIQEAVFSASVQHGRVSEILKNASDAALADGKDFRSLDAKEQLSYMYKARSAYVSGLSSVDEKTKASILNRYKREEVDVAALGSMPKTQVASTTTESPPSVPSAPAGAPTQAAAAAPPQASSPVPGTPAQAAAAAPPQASSPVPSAPAPQEGDTLSAMSMTGEGDIENMRVVTIIQPIIMKQAEKINNIVVGGTPAMVA